MEEMYHEDWRVDRTPKAFLDVTCEDGLTTTNIWIWRKRKQEVLDCIKRRHEVIIENKIAIKNLKSSSLAWELFYKLSWELHQRPENLNLRIAMSAHGTLAQ